MSENEEDLETHNPSAAEAARHRILDLLEPLAEEVARRLLCRAADPCAENRVQPRRKRRN